MINNNIPINYLKNYIIDNANSKKEFNGKNECSINTFYYLNELFNNKTINYDNKEIDISMLPFESVTEEQDCKVTYKKRKIDKIYVITGDSIESKCTLAHEIGHIYIRQCLKNNKDYINHETIPVFLELYISYMSSKNQYQLLRNKKIKYALSLLKGDYRWYRNSQKINYLYGFVQADLLFNKYLDNPILTSAILNEIIDDEISIDEGMSLLGCNIRNNNSTKINKKLLLT